MLSVCLFTPLIKFWMSEPIFMTVCISWHLSPFQWRASWIRPISVCVCMCISPMGARQRLGTHVLAATNTRYNRRIVGGVIFYKFRDVSKDSPWVCLCIPLSLLFDGSVNTFLRQRRIVGGVVSYEVRVVSKEIGRLFLPKTFFLRTSSVNELQNIIRHLYVDVGR
jgi:hypothetical protein